MASYLHTSSHLHQALIQVTTSIKNYKYCSCTDLTMNSIGVTKSSHLKMHLQYEVIKRFRFSSKFFNRTFTLTRLYFQKNSFKNISFKIINLLTLKINLIIQTRKLKEILVQDQQNHFDGKFKAFTIFYFRRIFGIKFNKHFQPSEIQNLKQIDQPQHMPFLNILKFFLQLLHNYGYFDNNTKNSNYFKLQNRKCLKIYYTLRVQI
eukprot:TRINITY_DN8304_c0_g1_i2.p1 TRINITY_DN8304_c0_g1~~TRINITY_DN8304_c0_g1_i2.p1  ORF type:complete len:206 (-),score=-18.22 TRINITY_DN8304_c0_g1_i2:115-732(-)